VCVCVCVCVCVRPGSVVVRVLARDTKRRGFDSRPFHFHVATLGKLFIHVSHKVYNLVLVKGR